MAIVKNSRAVLVPNAGNLRLQGCMVRRVVHLPASGYLSCVGLLSRQVDRMPVKVGQRAKARGVLPRIQAHPIRRAVHVNDVAMRKGPHGRDALQQRVIQRVNMPIRISQRRPARVQRGGDILRHPRARMRQAQYDGARTLMHFYHNAACSRSPDRTMAAIASISGANILSSFSFDTRLRNSRTVATNAAELCSGARASIPCAAHNASIP